MSSNKKLILPFEGDVDLEELVRNELVLEVDPLEAMAREEEEYSREEACNDMPLRSNDNVDHFVPGRDAMGKPLRGLPGVHPFSSYVEKMRNVTGDGKVKKQVLRQGNGLPCPENASVTVHYNAFLEFGQVPYDSTVIHRKPLKCSLLDFVEGLGIAIRTMMKKEQAQFLVHPDLAYRAVGVPPRIPRNATILYEVELIDFTEIKVEGESEENAGAEKIKKTKFQSVMTSSEKAYREASECFNQRNYQGAIQNYHKALAPLERCNLANEEEQLQQEKLLLRLYLNLAVCFNKVQKPRQACNMCKAALKLDFKNTKALFNFGRALATIGDYSEAKVKLKKALQLNPSEKETAKELEKVEAKHKEYMENNKLFTQRMFKS